MSTEIHCCLSGTVVTPWKPVTPPTGKEHNELKLKLDDKELSGKRIAGRSVVVKCYDRGDYLVHVQEGQRIFVSGTVQAQGYAAKKDGKPAAYSVVYAKTVAIEGDSGTAPQAAPASDTRYPQAANARMAQPSLPKAGPPEDEEPPF